MILNMDNDSESNVVNRSTYKRVMWERRFMVLATVLTVMCGLLFLIAIITAGWVIVSIDFAGNYTKTLYIGIWGEYVRVLSTDEGNYTVTWIWHFPNPPESVQRLLAVSLPHFYRAQAVFSAISLLLMAAGNGVAVYSVYYRHRYMYKRLTALLHTFAAFCVLIVIEVMIHSIGEWEIEIHQLQMQENQEEFSFEDFLDERTKYSYSTHLSWFVFACYLFAGLVFLFGSRKRKGSQAATQEFEIEDRPLEIRR